MYHNHSTAQFKDTQCTSGNLSEPQAKALNSLVERLSAMDVLTDTITARFSDSPVHDGNQENAASELRNIISNFRKSEPSTNLIPFKRPFLKRDTVSVKPVMQSKTAGLNARQLENDVFPDHFKEVAARLSEVQNKVLTRSYLSLVVDIQKQLENLCMAVEDGTVDEKLRQQSDDLRKRILQASQNFPACTEPLSQSLDILDELTMKLRVFEQISYVPDEDYDLAKKVEFENIIKKTVPHMAVKEFEPQSTSYVKPDIKKSYRSRIIFFKNALKIDADYMPTARQCAYAIAAILLVFPAYQFVMAAKKELQSTFFHTQSASVPASKQKPVKYAAASNPDLLTTGSVKIAKSDEKLSKLKLNQSLDVPTIPSSLSDPALIASIAAGDSAAMYELGMKLREGRGVDRDQIAALNWFKASAEIGNIPSILRYAKMLEKGEGIPKDINTAMSYYQRAADKGSREAAHNLAALHASGANGTADYKQAFTLFDRAARAGYVDSQYNLGVLYAAGQGVKQSLPDSYKWFSIAAQGGDKNAATSRDEIARQLDPQALSAAKAQLRKFSLAPSPDLSAISGANLIE